MRSKAWLHQAEQKAKHWEWLGKAALTPVSLSFNQFILFFGHLFHFLVDFLLLWGQESFLGITLLMHSGLSACPSPPRGGVLPLETHPRASRSENALCIEAPNTKTLVCRRGGRSQRACRCSQPQSPRDKQPPASVVEDEDVLRVCPCGPQRGWHDPVAGPTHPSDVARRGPG